MRWFSEVARFLKIERHSTSPGDTRPTAIYLGNNRLLVGTVVGGKPMAFQLEADDRLLTPWLALTGVHEKEVTNFILRVTSPGSHCIDVGANFGWFACIMGRARQAARVIAVEPDPELAGLCRDNSCINGVLEQVDVICGAAANHSGEIVLHRREYRSGNTSVVPADERFTTLLNEPPATAFTARSYTIDELAQRLGGRVDLIKIDVEGAEPLVLAGAAKTIADNPQLTIVMEWSPGQIETAGLRIGDFAAQIAALGLQCSYLAGRKEVSIDLGALLACSYRSAIILRRQVS